MTELDVEGNTFSTNVVFGLPDSQSLAFVDVDELSTANVVLDGISDELDLPLRMLDIFLDARPGVAKATCVFL